jgi:hypothetical protein
MPDNSFNILRIIPELVSGLINLVTDEYTDTHSLSSMAKEARPQIEPKIRVMGKTYKRFVAPDIPEGSEVNLIQDNQFTDEEYTAPQYGRGFGITANDLLLNPQYPVAFNSNIKSGMGATLAQRTMEGSRIVIEQIKRAEDMQMKNILDNMTVSLTNYTDVVFDRDTDNSAVITTANRKWTIANATTMKPFQDMADWTEQIADRGNSGNAEMFVVLGRSAYKAYVNSDDYKDDSNQRRNYKVERLSSLPLNNINIPKGAVYRESILKNAVSIIHIFTHNETYTNNSGDPVQWFDDDKVYILASDNAIIRKPVMTPNMLGLMPMTSEMKSLLRSAPQSGGWLVHPEWEKCTMYNFVMGVRKKFLTIPLTPNKTFTATVNS